MAHLAGIDKGPVFIGLMTMVWWNTSGNGRRRWKFYSEDLSMLLVMVLSAATSSTGLKNPEWSWLTSGKLKERLQKITEITLADTLNCLRNTFLQNPML